MAKIKYANIKIGADRLAVIEQATAICDEYAAQGLRLTLRQVYYQHVARGLMANKQANYKRLGDILGDARMAGLFDWDHLHDRTRNLVDLAHWRSPSQLIENAARQYRTDLWKPQRERVEVWIEKDAGIGVIEGVCQANDVPYFSTRGYTSISELWSAAQRVGDHLRRGSRVTILHVGDHDPSGIDMSRDIGQRLATFLLNDWRREFGGSSDSRAIRQSMRDGMRSLGSSIADETPSGREVPPWRVRRIALTHEQVLQYEPPPNPAKVTDSRFAKYVEETGLDESWELDALEPSMLADLIDSNIRAVRNDAVWDRSNYQQERDRALLTKVSEAWPRVTEPFLADLPPAENDDEDDDRG